MEMYVAQPAPTSDAAAGRAVPLAVVGDEGDVCGPARADKRRGRGPRGQRDVAIQDDGDRRPKERANIPRGQHARRQRLHHVAAAEQRQAAKRDAEEHGRRHDARADLLRDGQGATARREFFEQELEPVRRGPERHEAHEPKTGRPPRVPGEVVVVGRVQPLANEITAHGARADGERGPRPGRRPAQSSPKGTQDAPP
eukprot:CAMPEP_0184193762 /NCGR_PEP_ID=MMETSP0976-20121227/4151_1 /TAXON_ID=483370 /ORGANISM="non described non described, Strain CCMP2097" /LENGTH=197 /DNA_ID=CAMNT_0026498185 /DNA_START=19 /DNA_END=609 /DNA_ORIENTATION=+